MKKGLGSIPKGLAWIGSKKKHIKNKEGRAATKETLFQPVGPIKSSQLGLCAGWTRATFIITEDHCQKLKALAYWDRRTVKDLVDEALKSYLKNKRVKAMPEKR